MPKYLAEAILVMALCSCVAPTKLVPNTVLARFTPSGVIVGQPIRGKLILDGNCLSIAATGGRVYPLWPPAAQVLDGGISVPKQDGGNRTFLIGETLRLVGAPIGDLSSVDPQTLARAQRCGGVLFSVEHLEN